MNYQNVSVAFAIVIMRVALQGKYEHNKLPNCKCGTTQCYNRVSLSVWSQIVSLCFFFSWRYNPIGGCILQPSSGL